MPPGILFWPLLSGQIGSSDYLANTCGSNKIKQLNFPEKRENTYEIDIIIILTFLKFCADIPIV